MQAEQALRNLNNKKLFGKEMKLKLSKFPKVNMPKEGADTYNLTKEYLNSPLHRYRKTGSKNYQNIYWFVGFDIFVLFSFFFFVEQ